MTSLLSYRQRKNPETIKVSGTFFQLSDANMQKPDYTLYIGPEGLPSQILCRLSNRS